MSMGEKGRVVGAAGGAIGLGGLAAALGLCCVTPWAVALLGVTGAITFARLAFLMPYAIAGAVLLLAVGFWWAYRRPAACNTGACNTTSRRSLQWVVWIASALVMGLAIIALTFGLASSARADGGGSPAGYTVLDDSASQLRDDFNRAKGSVRLLFVVDPICPGCLRGLDDLNRALLGKTKDSRLQTFVVHVPVLSPPPKAKDVGPAAQVLDNPHVRHYWNPTGSFGRQLSEAVNLRRGNEPPVYAWDVWLIYDPQTSWGAAGPPRPQLLMHQLRALQGSAEFPHLDEDAFAKEAHRLLDELRNIDVPVSRSE
jgi:mercuric ion transport protein